MARDPSTFRVMAQLLAVGEPLIIDTQEKNNLSENEKGTGEEQRAREGEVGAPTEKESRKG